MDDARRRGVHSPLLAPRCPQGFHAGAPLRFFSQPLQRLSIEVSSTHRPYPRTASTSPTLHRGVDVGLDGNRYPSLPALPEGNASVGFSAGGVSAREFVVRTAPSTNAMVFPPLCTRVNAGLCPVAPFCLLLACAAWHLAACLPQPTALNTDHKRRCFLSSPPPSRSNPHKQPSLLHP